MKPIAFFAAFIAFLISAQVLLAQTDEKPDYLKYFDPVKGFKTGADQPDGYLAPNRREPRILRQSRAVSAPHEGRARTDQRDVSREVRARSDQPLPAYMTADYLDTLEKNWNILSPKLGLETLAKEDGEMMVGIIKGAKGTGTIVITLFNDHQKQVFAAMSGKAPAADFDTLQTQLLTQLELNDAGRAAHAAEIARTVTLENRLSDSEKTAYASFLQRDYFTKADFTALDLFYKSAYDRLTEQGKTEMHNRIQNGMRGTGPRSDAVEMAALMNNKTQKLFAQLDAAMSPDDAATLKAAITSIYVDMGRMAQSELEAGLAEWAIKDQRTAAQ